MKITGLRKQVVGERIRVSADVHFENKDAEPFELYFETIAEFADDLQPDPNALVTAAAIPAMHLGEKRIHIEGEVCPQLRDGLNMAQRLIKHWYGEPRVIADIEASEGFQPRQPVSPGRTSSFLSGGVDSLAILKHNRDNYPLDHPHAIKDCFLVYGLDVGNPNQPDRYDVFDTTVASMREVADDVGATLIPVYTNVRHLVSDWKVYANEQFASCLAAITHSFGSRINRGLIAMDNTVEYVFPHGSHPRLNTYYSSSNFDFVSAAEHLSRLDKVAIIADWEVALKNLRVCFTMDDIADCEMNCGQCSKCIRTIVELYTLGKLDKATSFKQVEITAELLNQSKIGSACSVEYYEELIEPMSRLGKPEFADILRRKVDEFKNPKQSLKRRIGKLVGVTR